MPTCYRHPARETGVACSNCGRPICPDCMTPTPVGMRCPECAKQRTKVHTSRSLGGTAEPLVTYAVIAICVIAFLAGGEFGVSDSSTSTWLYRNGVLFGPLVHDGELWRLVTGGFLHSGLLHIGFNMLLLYWLGTEIERRLGNVRFGLVYLTALLGGSLGALIQTTATPTVGASGAVFGLMGYALVEMRRQGINPLQSQIGFLLIFNVVLSLRPGANISFGGHLGGLVFGALAAVVLHEVARRRGPAWLAPALLLGLCAIAVVGSVLMSGQTGITDSGNVIR
ncbi:rhomboid family intramembrane serine protease [Patulibacter defluvii]|uniref:rhomboid family intramembrane serine protease n=1 Tax=Patulibacter defluvii TaxID=3095358 RepID=UPI002A74B7B9|nr:rhomboid family intramembrane serine protease [Patulibacter sp. DM4]